MPAPVCHQPQHQRTLLLHLQIAEGGVLPLLRKSFAQKNDIFLVNFGSWHRRSSGDWTDYYTALRHLGDYYQVMMMLLGECCAWCPMVLSGDNDDDDEARQRPGDWAGAHDDVAARMLSKVSNSNCKPCHTDVMLDIRLCFVLRAVAMHIPRASLLHACPINCTAAQYPAIFCVVCATCLLPDRPPRCCCCCCRPPGLIGRTCCSGRVPPPTRLTGPARGAWKRKVRHETHITHSFHSFALTCSTCCAAKFAVLHTLKTSNRLPGPQLLLASDAPVAV
jgi:hypothetical protein